MKVIVTESQLRNLVKRQRDKRKMEKDVEEAASLTSPSTTNTSTPTSTSSSSSGDDGTVINVPERPDGVPEMNVWKSGMVRGVANPAGESVKKREDYPEAEPVRGKANPLR